MLKSIDILIGLSLVMLFVSMGVTILTQAMLALRQTRGRHLLEGLSDLLSYIHPSLKGRHAEEIAKLTLTDPLISNVKISKWTLYGDVIHRDELTKMLLGLATEEGKVAAKTAPQEEAIAALRKAIEENGIADPEQTLERVRMIGLELEQSHPEFANDFRQSIALLQEAPSQFLAKINNRFDQTMDRVRERFTFSARIWTLLGSILVTVILQLDTVTLVNRLAMDDAMRLAFVQEAMSGIPRPLVSSSAEPVPRISKAISSPMVELPSKEFQGSEEESKQVNEDELQKSQQYYFSFLAKQGVIAVPGNLKEWIDNWKHVNIPGLILTILLLSMGAPFWYSTLSRLLQLRSTLAAKDDVQRIIRQTKQPMKPVREDLKQAIKTDHLNMNKDNYDKYN